MGAHADGGRNFYGSRLGLLARRTVLPRLVGDPANALSFPFPVRYAVLDRADHGSAMSAARRLVEEGAEAIGFAFNPDFDLDGTLPVPVAGNLSAALDLVAAMLPATARIATLAFGPAPGRTAVPGHLADAVGRDSRSFDIDLARAEIAAAAAGAAADPSVRALLLWEPEMGPFARDAAAAAGIAAYDRVRFLRWFHSGLAPRTFPR